MCKKKAVRDFVLLMDFFSSDEEIAEGDFHIEVELPDDHDEEEEKEEDEE